MKIIDLEPEEHSRMEQIAKMMVEAFRQSAPDWVPDVPAALEEIYENFEEGRISLIAINDDGLVVGWIGGRHNYAKVWELHPLVVRPSHHRRGIGRMLVAELEQRVAARGCVTLILGTDDLTAATSIGGIDLYPNIWEHMANIRNLKGHPFEFYQSCGFVIHGLLPDANGPGLHDIMMAKRVGPLPSTVNN